MVETPPAKLLTFLLLTNMKMGRFCFSIGNFFSLIFTRFCLRTNSSVALYKEQWPVLSETRLCAVLSESLPSAAETVDARKAFLNPAGKQCVKEPFESGTHDRSLTFFAILCMICDDIIHFISLIVICTVASVVDVMRRHKYGKWNASLWVKRHQNGVFYYQNCMRTCTVNYINKIRKQIRCIRHTRIRYHDKK